MNWMCAVEALRSMKSEILNGSDKAESKKSFESEISDIIRTIERLPQLQPSQYQVEEDSTLSQMATFIKTHRAAVISGEINWRIDGVRHFIRNHSQARLFMLCIVECEKRGIRSDFSDEYMEHYKK